MNYAHITSQSTLVTSESKPKTKKRKGKERKGRYPARAVAARHDAERAAREVHRSDADGDGFGRHHGRVSLRKQVVGEGAHGDDRVERGEGELGQAAHGQGRLIAYDTSFGST